MIKSRYTTHFHVKILSFTTLLQSHHTCCQTSLSIAFSLIALRPGLSLRRCALVHHAISLAGYFSLLNITIVARWPHLVPASSWHCSPLLSLLWVQSLDSAHKWDLESVLNSIFLDPCFPQDALAGCHVPRGQGMWVLSNVQNLGKQSGAWMHNAWTGSSESEDLGRSWFGKTMSPQTSTSRGRTTQEAPRAFLHGAAN